MWVIGGAGKTESEGQNVLSSSGNGLFLLYRLNPGCCLVVQGGGLHEAIAHHFIMSKMADHITSGSSHYTTSRNDKTVTMGFHHSWVIGPGFPNYYEQLRNIY